MGMIFGDPTDPQRDSGGPSRMLLTCHDCRWRTSSVSAIAAVHAAQAHHTATGHAISYKGTIQEWARREALPVKGAA